MDSIDDIFDSKGKSASLQPLASSSKQPDKKKKKDKKKKRTEEPSDPEPKPLSKKRRVPETVVDPSTTIPSAKRAKVAAAPSQKVQKPKKKDDSKEEEDRFKDSRGSGPRRKTEEGFSIFKEDELGIGDEGGGVDVIVNLHFVTHFYSPVQILLYAHSIVNVVSSIAQLYYFHMDRQTDSDIQSTLLFGSFEASRVAYWQWFEEVKK